MERITLTDAARRLQIKCSLPNQRYAQKVLIATFIEELATPSCDAYWITITVGSKATQLKPPHENGVPSDFWTLDHAIETEENDGFIPSGSRCSWGGISNFYKDVTRSGYAVREMFQDLRFSDPIGAEPVRIEFSAMDVRIASVDLEAIISRKAFAALLRRVDRRPSIQTGNLTKSNIERLWARLCCLHLTVAHKAELTSNPDKLLEAVRSTAEKVSEEATIGDPAMKRIAELIRKEAAKFHHPPPS